jgi:hypothetical protein
MLLPGQGPSYPLWPHTQLHANTSGKLKLRFGSVCVIVQALDTWMSPCKGDSPQPMLGKGTL